MGLDTKMLTVAYVVNGGWVLKKPNAYGCLRYEGWVGLKKPKCLRMLMLSWMVGLKYLSVYGCLYRVDSPPLPRPPIENV